ncbi:(2Fe-2S) ferredoxin domain-containing protein [Romeria aff. gracilis LEGE 07310]|uniref:(2Fe-2S) ferredoxin domain-containing protein n=1 Tax=Vasconcelosia minhoensis LEGE 07310 TaxID=915328 RepID=A0A8J7A830_9CYAN|nr:(2Fe-2S) ferredoxin domain-containing protein [Romeria gracilis]MBE9078797.1 (2Fe-2S) ferredoxin domain-containing protein [Romeria aff. gracilis LEGE 07310]
MQVLQGRYTESLSSSKGKLKAMHLETSQGLKRIQLPKPLRAIAHEELAVGDIVRVWAESEKKGLQAVQIVPLSPKARITYDAKLAKKSNKSAPKVQICQKKNCCKRGGTALWQAFESTLAEQPSSLKLEASGCLGGCKHGPNIRILPKNVKYRNVEPSQVEEIIQRHSPTSALQTPAHASD